MCLTLVLGRPFDPNWWVVVVVVPKGVHLHPGAEKVVDLLEGVLLFPGVFDQVLIMRGGTRVIDGLLRAQVLDDLSDTHKVSQGHVQFLCAGGVDKFVPLSALVCQVGGYQLPGHSLCQLVDAALV